MRQKARGLVKIGVFPSRVCAVARDRRGHKHDGPFHLLVYSKCIQPTVITEITYGRPSHYSSRSMYSPRWQGFNRDFKTEAVVSPPTPCGSLRLWGRDAASPRETAWLTRSRPGLNVLSVCTVGN